MGHHQLVDCLAAFFRAGIEACDEKALCHTAVTRAVIKAMRKEACGEECPSAAVIEIMEAGQAGCGGLECRLQIVSTASWAVLEAPACGADLACRAAAVCAGIQLGVELHGHKTDPFSVARFSAYMRAGIAACAGAVYCLDEFVRMGIAVPGYRSRTEAP